VVCQIVYETKILLLVVVVGPMLHCCTLW